MTCAERELSPNYLVPVVCARGEDTTNWPDHTEIRPTMMLLLGLHDDYVHHGRALLEPFDPAVGTAPGSAGTARRRAVARVYK